MVPSIAASLAAGGAQLTAEVLSSLESQSESVLIQRVWRCHLAMKRAQQNYRAKKLSMDVLRHSNRSALRNLSLFMYRLRAFSRQYKGQMTVYDDLVSAAGLAEPLDGHAELGQGARGYIGASAEDDDVLQYQDSGGDPERERSRIARRAVSFLHRLPHVAYALHVENLLLMYRPHDGTQHVQLFGGSGYLLYSTVEKPQPRLEARSQSSARKASPRPSAAKKSSARRKMSERTLSSRLPSDLINPADSEQQANSAPRPPSSYRQLPSINSFMLPFVSGSDDSLPPTPHAVSVDLTQQGGARHTPLAGMRSISEEEPADSRGQVEVVSAALGKATRPPLPGRTPFDRSISGGSIGGPRVMVDLLSLGQESPVSVRMAGPTGEPAQEEGDFLSRNLSVVLGGSGSPNDDSSLACSSTSSENLHAKDARRRKPSIPQQLRLTTSGLWANSASRAPSSNPAEAGSAALGVNPPARRLDSLISMLSFSAGSATSNASFSRMGSMESLFHALPLSPSEDRRARLQSLSSVTSGAQSDPAARDGSDSKASSVPRSGASALLSGGKGDSHPSSSDSDIRLGDPVPRAASFVPFSTFDASLEVSLGAADLALLFELSVADSEAACGGGKVHRAQQFECMSAGVLSAALTFLKSSAHGEEQYEALGLQRSMVSESVRQHEQQAVATFSATPSFFGRATSWQRRPTGRGNSTSLSTISTTTGSLRQHSASNMSVGSSNADTDTTQVPGHSLSRGKSMLGGTLFGMFHQSTTDLLEEEGDSAHNESFCDSPLGSAGAALAPMQPIPLTLLCDRGLQGVPWEVLLPDSSVVRSLTMLSLCAQNFSRRSASLPGSSSGAGHGRSASHQSHNSTSSQNLGDSLVGRPPLSTPKHSGRLLRSPQHRGGDASILAPSQQQQQRMKGYLGPGWVSVTLGCSHGCCVC